MKGVMFMNKYLGVKLIQAELMDYEKIMEILSRPIEQRERQERIFCTLRRWI